MKENEKCRFVITGYRNEVRSEVHGDKGEIMLVILRMMFEDIEIAAMINSVSRVFKEQTEVMSNDD